MRKASSITHFLFFSFLVGGVVGLYVRSLTPTCGEAVFLFQIYDTQGKMEQIKNRVLVHTCCDM